MLLTWIVEPHSVDFESESVRHRALVLHTPNVVRVTMQSILHTHLKRSNQVEDYYRECLNKSIGRIKRIYEEERCTSMTLKLGEIAGLKGFLPPNSMHDLVKVVRLGLEKAGVRARRCRDPHHLLVEWGDILKESIRPQVRFNKHTELLAHATADGGGRYIFNGDSRAAIPMLDEMTNPLKCR
jgi:hypothetical protein